MQPDRTLTQTHLSIVFLVVEPSKIKILIYNTIPEKEDIILLSIGVWHTYEIRIIGHDHVVNRVCLAEWRGKVHIIAKRRGEHPS